VEIEDPLRTPEVGVHCDRAGIPPLPEDGSRKSILEVLKIRGAKFLR